MEAAVHEKWIGHRCVIAFEGELDLATVPLLERTVAEAIESGATDLWLDLEPTTFLDVAGLRSLYAAAHACGALNRQLLVISPDGSPPRRLLRLVRAERRLQIHPSRHAAQLAA